MTAATEAGATTEAGTVKTVVCAATGGVVGAGITVVGDKVVDAAVVTTGRSTGTTGAGATVVGATVVVVVGSVVVVDVVDVVVVVDVVSTTGTESGTVSGKVGVVVSSTGSVVVVVVGSSTGSVVVVEVVVVVVSCGTESGESPMQVANTVSRLAEVRNACLKTTEVAVPLSVNGAVSDCSGTFTSGPW